MSDYSHESTLNHYRHQARHLLRALQNGEQDAATRISRHLPRLSGMDPSTVPVSEVQLQEAQHVVAREAGYAKWADLTAAAEEDISALRYLSDADLRVLIPEVSIPDLALALAGLASGPTSHQHEAVFGLLRQMPTDVRQEVQRQAAGQVENEALIDAAWKRIALQARLLAEEGRIHPGKRDSSSAAPDVGSVPEALPVSGPLSLDPAIERLRVRCDLLEEDEIEAGLQKLSEAAGRGELEAAIPPDAEGILWQGLRLLVDGTEPSLIKDILESHVETALRQLELRRRLVTEAIRAIGLGDNPRIVTLKLLPIYRTDELPSSREPEGTVELAQARLARRPASEMDLDELTLFLTDLAWTARRRYALEGDGLAPLGTIADSVDDPFLKDALKRLAGPGGQTGDALHEAVHSMVEALEVQRGQWNERDAHRYLRVVVGVMSISEALAIQRADADSNRP